MGGRGGVVGIEREGGNKIGKVWKWRRGGHMETEGGKGNLERKKSMAGRKMWNGVGK